MTGWKRSSEALAQRFQELVPDDPRVERRKMFGYPCCFANGNMFIGLHQESMLLRLPEKQRRDFLEQYATELFSPFPGRVMKEYAVVPAGLIEKPKELRRWIMVSLRYASELPAKASKRGRGK